MQACEERYKHLQICICFNDSFGVIHFPCALFLQKQDAPGTNLRVGTAIFTSPNHQTQFTVHSMILRARILLT